MMATQEYVNQLVLEAAAQAGGTLSYADVLNAAANLGIPASQIQAAVSTGVITGAPAPAAPAPAPVQMPSNYDQAYVNQLVQEAAQQAGGTLSYADAMNAASNLGISPSMMQSALSTGAITGAPSREASDLAERTRLAQLTATQQAEAARAAEAARIRALQNNIPQGYDQAYVNRLIGEAAQQAGGTLSYADASRALNQLGIPLNMLNSAMGSGFITEGVTPFANATQGFQQNFNNYTSIPIGGQFNPGAVGGASPYSQIMGQMRPVGNPYAGVIANQPMGGYNPNIYDTEMPRRQNMLDRLMNPSIFDQSGFGDSGPGAGPGASDGPSAAASASDFGGFNGGLITKVMGPNPPTPDDGTMFVQKGEYIVKKDSVNKYGKGLLDKINDGKIPAKKMKSLLG